MKRNVAPVIGLVLCVLAAAGCAERSETTDIAINVTRLHEKAVYVGTGEAYDDSLLALASERGLVVIDTGVAPSLTRLYRAKVEELFGRDDFRWVINTHFHFDHTDGNQVFPEATIVGHELVPRRMRQFDENRADFVAQRRARLEDRRRQLEELDPESDAAQRIRDLITTSERMCDDLESGFVSTPPTLTFSDRMTLDLGDMTLRMAAFGPATHTGDDIVVHVPELDLVATGDLFFEGAIQFAFRLEKGLDIEKKLAVLDSVLEDEGLRHVVTVHNGISSREPLERWRDYMRWVWDAVEQTHELGGTLDDAREILDLDERFPDPEAVGLNPDTIARQHDNSVAIAWLAGTGGRDASLAVAEILDERGIEAARAFFAEALPLRDERFLVDEFGFNALGYRFLGEGRNEEAVAVFEMNVEAFPEAWNVHDSLGEALAAMGRTEEALASYRRSVELNPDNTNGVTAIERLESGE